MAAQRQGPRPADARMDDFHNMASGVPYLHHFVETSENPQHGEQSDHSDVATAKVEAENFIAGKELEAAWKALGGATDQALDALGQASHTAQDIVRHQFETAGDHPLGEAPATDAETKAAVAATQQVEKDFETVLTTMGHQQNMSDAQIQSFIDKLKAWTTMTPNLAKGYLSIPPVLSLVVALLLGGVPFSLFLMRLGIDIESPELIRYVLLGSPVLSLLLVAIAFRWRPLSQKKEIIYILWWSVAMCVPAEAIEYICVSWQLRGWSVFSIYNLPFLLLLLATWSMALGLASAMLVFVLRKGAKVFGKSESRF